MSGAAIHTLRDLLIPNGQDTRCFLGSIDKTAGQNGAARTTSFTLPLWKPERLPSSVHLCEYLPTKMLEHLGAILDQSYSDQAARTSFTNHRGRTFTPNNILERLRDDCVDQHFRFNYEDEPKALSRYLSSLVCNLYHAMTGRRLVYRAEQRATLNQAVSDFSYQVDGGLHTLGEDKSPKVFNHFIGQLMG